jgi:thiol-disulfide isomerase/thioredoxin
MIKAADKEQFQATWSTRPVTVDPIDAAGVAALARNDTKRFRVINVWATWCAPCVHEFPELVRMSQRFETRPFEMLTISLDDPKENAGVLRFLKKQRAAVPATIVAAVAKEGRRTNNYYYTGTDTDAFGRALDSAWPGPLPYTVVLAPGGEVIYRHSGELDTAELQSFLVDKLGAYYDAARINAVR